MVVVMLDKLRSLGLDSYKAKAYLTLLLLVSDFYLKNKSR